MQKNKRIRVFQSQTRGQDITWEHSVNLRVMLTQTEDVICWDVLLLRSQKVQKSALDQLLYLWLLPTWEEGTQDWQSPWWLLDSLANLFVSLAECLVFELRSEGSEASCAKHAPGVLRVRRGHALPGVWTESISAITTVTASCKVLYTVGLLYHEGKAAS